MQVKMGKKMQKTMNKTAEEAIQGDDDDTRGCDYIPMSGNDHNGDTKDDTDMNG